MGFLKSLLLSLVLLTSCVAPGSYTELNGRITGHVRVGSEWLVAIGRADASLISVIPPGVVVNFPLHVQEGHWLVVNLRTGEVTEGNIADPLPPGPASMYGPDEWFTVLLNTPKPSSS